MASVEITVRRDNGTSIVASGDVPDAQLVQMATNLTKILSSSISATSTSAS